MNNGIVLKVNHSSVVVLTANGEYLKCKKLLSSYSIGEEIQFPSNAIILNKKIKMSIPKLIPVIIASGLILFSFIFVNLNNNEALAAGKVTIDSEAKVSLILDKQLKVIALKGHNEQGKQVINKMDNWKHEPLHLVMDDLVGEMEKSKVIDPDETINLTGEMRKEFENKQSELNHELKDIQESNNHINIPNSKELDQPKVKIENQNQSQNKQEKSFNSNSTKVTKGETNYKDKSILKSPSIEKDKNNDNGHSKETKNDSHQDEHWGNKQRQWSHRNTDEHHESSNQNQKKQYNNYEKHQDKKKKMTIIMTAK
ncbi:anti-sigma factor domain-containing protein [Gottfriedia acidiceleris]|uniref:anti-sigma factor domain-containing protein n=1 Tax=Gottfriedia acidiceleris TaxID=371036 RepID=UPI00101BB4D5|nr:anti-sigma factor domain-containing protein [Gottfriedia acidiceleris]